MSNIERRYAYLDEGVFPVEGEYGVTYLTLYSSNAGNTYDGWVYDPDHRVEESLTERTYGYRNPDYPQYCWDDEVVVDLSNAQNRQESSEYVQGRITSFNTNVSSTPIFLPDINITGLTEEERENRATVVLFSAIPLVKDAYIQAQVEVQCKCNLSPNNTSGEMRIEAFYILNDESDRTMRPNPVHTFFVDSENERHTLPWLYFNPALKHEDHNYIGVKLVCTGGTAEIGISDDPDYGDAIITLASAGLTGDHIDTGTPVSLEIFGKEEVIAGYELDINDYTVLCTYDTGETYEVTRMCNFTPIMGTEIIEPFTVLTALYMGLTASMVIRLGQIEFIELSGVDTIHGSYTLDIDDYTVLAYLDNGDVMDVTDECTFSPAMGTTISSATVLTATYEPYWMPGSSFTDSLNISAAVQVRQSSTSHDLIYTLYDDNVLVITGGVSDSWEVDDSYYDDDESILSHRTVRGMTRSAGNPGVINPQGFHSYFSVDGRTLRNVQRHFDAEDSNVSRAMTESMYYYIVDLTPFGTSASLLQVNKIEWRATGKPLGICAKDVERNNSIEFVNFNNMDTSRIVTLAHAFEGLSDSDLSWLNNKEFPSLRDLTSTFAKVDDNDSIESINAHNISRLAATFSNNEYGQLPRYVYDLDVLSVRNADLAFYRSSFEDTNKLYKWIMPNVLTTNGMFRENPQLKDISGLSQLGLQKNYDFGLMFFQDTELVEIGTVLNSWSNNSGNGSEYASNGITGIFANCMKLEKVYGAGAFMSKIANDNTSVGYMFMHTAIKDTIHFVGAITSKVTNIDGLFSDCHDLEDITYLSTWYFDNVKTSTYFLYGTKVINPDDLESISEWKPLALFNPSSMLGVRVYASTSAELAEAREKVEAILSTLSEWNTHLRSRNCYIASHYFPSSGLGQGYEILFYRYNSSSGSYETMLF